MIKPKSAVRKSMKRIWRMAGVGLLVVSVGSQAMADERDNSPGPGHGPQGQHERGPEGGPRPEHNLPIQGRPDTVRQTQEPRQGYYRDIPRRNDDDRHWEAGGPGPRAGNDHPNDNRWPGRPDGHGNGWGPGPQHRPGYVIDRFPERNYRVPYRGQDYFYSGGYWYRPQGPRYVVVQPPAQVPSPQPAPQGNGYDVVAYPANGQSPAQVQQDGYDCYRWAVQQSGFDPRTVTYAPDPAVVQTYRQAQGNCLGSRGYQVQY